MKPKSPWWNESVDPSFQILLAGFCAQLSNLFPAKILFLQMEGFTNNWFLAGWLAGLFSLTAGMLNFFSSWVRVRDRSSPTRSAAPENIFNTLQAQLQSLKKDFITRTIDVQNYCKQSDKDQHTNKHTHHERFEFWRRPTFSIPFILVYCLYLPSNKKIWRWLIAATSTTTITMKEATPSIGGRGGGETTQHKTKQTNLRQFWKNLCHNFTIWNRVGHSTPIGGGCNSCITLFFSPNSLLWHSMLFVVTVECRVRTSCCLGRYQVRTLAYLSIGQASLGQARLG